MSQMVSILTNSVIPFIKVAAGACFGRSLFERLSLMGHPKHLLNVQYRMHPSISLFPNSRFYSSKISDGPNVKAKSYNKKFLPGPMFGSYSFININDGREEKDSIGHSWKNMVEADFVLKIVNTLFKGGVVISLFVSFFILRLDKLNYVCILLRIPYSEDEETTS